MIDEEKLRQIGEQAANNLTLLTQAKIMELAGQRLHSRREKFVKAVSIQEEGTGVWIIHLDESQHWVEDGVPQHSMIPDLVNSPKAKIARDGSRYLVVPFTHKVGEVGPTQTTSYQQDLVSALKKEMKAQKIPWGKIEKDDQGRPKLGKLHTLKLKTPVKTHDGPGQGWGQIGQQRVGATGIPFLAGAHVFQTKNEKGKVERGVVTFRIASEKMLGSGRWEFPGIDKAAIFEDAYEWAQKEVQEHVLPDIIRQIQESK